MNFISDKGKYYKLSDHPFKGGGEGDVYNIIGEKTKCAKIYHSNTSLKVTEKN